MAMLGPVIRVISQPHRPCACPIRECSPETTSSCALISTFHTPAITGQRPTCAIRNRQSFGMRGQRIDWSAAWLWLSLESRAAEKKYRGGEGSGGENYAGKKLAVKKSGEIPAPG